MMTRYYLRETKEGTQFISCYDVEHSTDKYSGLNAALKAAAEKGHQVIEILDAIALTRGGTNDN